VSNRTLKGSMPYEVGRNKKENMMAARSHRGTRPLVASLRWRVCGTIPVIATNLRSG
jgi:hypothetical protein